MRLVTDFAHLLNNVDFDCLIRNNLNLLYIFNIIQLKALNKRWNKRTQCLPACVRLRQLASRTPPKKSFVRTIAPSMQLMGDRELWCCLCPSRAPHTPSAGHPPAQLPHQTHCQPLPATCTIESARDKLKRNKCRTLLKKGKDLRKFELDETKHWYHYSI